MNTLAFPLSFKSIDDAGLIEGVGAVFGNVDHGGDRMMPGAFSKSLAGHDARPVPMLLGHDLKRPIGAWTELRETPEGLACKGRITIATRDGAEAHALARDQALTGLSIGYIPTRDAVRGQVRELHEVKVFEISLVSVPLNDLARITSVKAIASVRDLEDVLHEGGLSGRRAKTAAAAAWKAINDQDSDHDADAALTAFFSASAKRLGIQK